MNILLTNDDGYNMPGINLLQNILSEYGTVYVVAPQTVKSGAGCSLTLNSTQNYIKYDEYNYAFDGTPVDCANFGLNALNVKFDLVVSGCNDGYNLSFDSMYSGTIGGCFQGLVNGVKAIAFSTDFNSFDIVKKECKNVLDFVINNKLLSNKYLLNVNFPISTYKESKGIKITKQDIRDFKYEYNLTNSDASYKRIEVSSLNDLDYDCFAVKNGYISITPLKITTYETSLYNKIKKKVGNI